MLIDERNNCLLSDFGIANILESNTYLTGTDNIIGTPMYMSTEQAEGKKVDARSDIYSLGIILYEMATGKVPYSAETPMAVIIKHLNDPLPLPRIRNPLLPEALERIILKALAKRPEERFASAREMVRPFSILFKFNLQRLRINRRLCYLPNKKTNYLRHSPNVVRVTRQ